MNVVEEIKEIVAKLDKIDDYNNSLCDKLSVVDSKTQDLLHYIENYKKEKTLGKKYVNKQYTEYEMQKIIKGV